MKEEEGEKERGREDIRTDADGGERKILWEGGGGEILIWRGKRERRVSPGHVTGRWGYAGKISIVLILFEVCIVLWRGKYLY